MDVLNLTMDEIDIEVVRKIYSFEDEINIIVPSIKHMGIIANEIGSSVAVDADLFNITLKIANLINDHYDTYDIIIDCPNYLAKHLENNLLDYNISVLYPIYRNNKIFQLIKSCNYR